MTYQRNTLRAQVRLRCRMNDSHIRGLPQQDVADEGLEDEICEPEVRADDRAGDDHDDRSLDDLALRRPLDLLELGPGLGDETLEAAARHAPGPRLGLRRLGRGADCLLPRACALRDALLLDGLLVVGRRALSPAALPPSLPRALGHLARLPVSRVSAAPAAVLLQLDAVGRVPLRLRALVVAAPALGAGKRDCVSDSTGHFGSFSLRGGSGGRTRTSDTRIMIPLL